MHPLAILDREFVWHPFTQMRDWVKRKPILILRGKGAVLQDQRGKEYLDANSSIWTNLHGHNHPKINAAIRRQLNKIAHSSALGLANEPASLLAEELVQLANAGIYDLRFITATRDKLIYEAGGERVSERTYPAGNTPAGTPALPGRRSQIGNRELTKVFFSDDGSTAMEVSLKLAYEFARRTGRSRKPRFLSMAGGYHGDTVGAVALGHIDLFHRPYAGLLFKTDEVMAPYCYRCPFNRAKPDRADAREYRKCNWECIGKVEQKFEAQKKRKNPYAGFVFEPIMQGAAGMIPQPAGWLGRAAEIARGHGALLIADEVMTAFGRMGGQTRDGRDTRDTKDLRDLRDGGGARANLFATQVEGVRPDFLAVAKGLTGGYLPMAATLTTQEVFDAFLGDYEEFKTFFHGHSFTANQLGAAAALASLEILQRPASVAARLGLEQTLREELKTLWRLPNVGDVRQAGLVAGVELVRDWRTREPFDLRERAGIRVCEEMARRGVLTRPIGNVIVLMPPYCTTAEQVRKMVSVLAESVTSARL